MSKKGSSKGYLAASDGGPNMQGQKEHMVLDPVSGGEKDDTTNCGTSHRKGGSMVEVHTNI